MGFLAYSHPCSIFLEILWPAQLPENYKVCKICTFNLLILLSVALFSMLHSYIKCLVVTFYVFNVLSGATTNFAVPHVFASMQRLPRDVVASAVARKLQITLNTFNLIVLLSIV